MYSRASDSVLVCRPVISRLKWQHHDRGSVAGSGDALQPSSLLVPLAPCHLRLQCGKERAEDSALASLRESIQFPSRFRQISTRRSEAQGAQVVS